MKPCIALLRLLTILVGIVFYTGCAFHLRGSLNQPTWLKHVAIRVEHADKAWEVILGRQLQQADIHLVTEFSHAKYWLIIEDEKTQSTIISISSSSSPRQYELIYEVRFSLQQNPGRDLISSSLIRINRPITINNDRILGSHDEQHQLEQEMRLEAAEQILDRIAHHPPQQGETHE